MENNTKPQPVQMNLNENNLGLAAHILGLVTSFIGPLIMYFLYRDTATKKLRANIINTLNWQLSFLVLAVVSMGYIFYEVNKLYNLSTAENFSLNSVKIVVGIIYLLQVLNIIFSITGAIKSLKGKIYKYPISINFIKSN